MTTATQPIGLYQNGGGSNLIQRPQDGRRVNLSLVLQSLYDEPQLTRAQLARQTGLTKVTISDLVSELIDHELVQETGITAGVRPGKPAVALAVREDSYDVLALDLSAPATWRGAVYSLRGHKQAEASVELDGRTGADAVEAAYELVQALIERSTRRILGVGVGSPGTVDADGMVVAAPNLDWRHVELQKLISRRFSLMTTVLNDANAAVIAESAFTDSASDLVRVQISRGVGAGVLLDGSLVIGNCAAGGEIGHLVIEYQGALCACGKRGCLETWLSVPALTRRLAANARDGVETLAEAGRRLGMALAPIVATLDLPEIVVGGPQDLVKGPLMDACLALIIERTHTEFRRDISMRLSDLGDEAVLLGAVSFVLRTTLGVS
ncbi:MAG: ROK family protein [Propionibacteriaceae bacterium]|jgi:predicted NBD/HSP70 family sugar kinase|nr:ROK family protein [Propionibacteriaceae bacterium]